MIQPVNFFLSFLSFSIVLQCADAYFVDSSCGTEESTLIHNSMRDVFGMTSQVITALHATPRSANVNRLIKLLFAAPDQDPATYNVEKLRGIFDGVRSLNNRLGEYPAENAKEVVIYCNLDRVTKNDDGTYTDTVSGNNLNRLAVLDPGQKHAIDDCGNDKTTYAVTWNPMQTGKLIEGQGRTFVETHQHPSQLTICPWFMKWYKFRKYRTWSDLSYKAAKQTMAIPWQRSRFGSLTPIDGLKFFDSTLMHELTHTTVGGDTDDMVTIKGGGMKGKGGQAYGWKAAKYLVSNKQDYVNQKQTPEDNADTLALFASAIRLLNMQPPKYVGDDGSIETTQPAKRDAMLYADQATTPAVFEGFITMVKEKYAAESDDPTAYLQI